MGEVTGRRAPTQVVDPRHAVTDDWFAASDFVIVKPTRSELPDNPEREASLTRAASLTCEAIAEMELADARLKALEADDPSTARKPVDRSKAMRAIDQSKARAAGLHALAARIRREAGAWADCKENFVALANYHVAIQRFEAAEAYVGKVMFVSRSAGDPEVELEACLFAMSTFLRIGKVKEASDIVGRARTLAKLYSGRGVTKRIDDAEAEVVAARRTNGSHRQMRTAFKRGPAPVEFEVRAVPAEVETATGVADASRNMPVQGIDLLMQRPGPAGECRYWVSHRVLDGSHEIVTLPNWSGRAMRAAKAIHAATKDDSEGTDGPSSVVLQVCCALEAYISAVVHFIRNADQHRWKKAKLPRYCSPDAGLKKRRVGTMQQWNEVPKSLFGAKAVKDWEWADFTLLFDLRDQLVHYKGDNEERVELNNGSTHPMMGRFNAVLEKPRRGPAPWVDRVLTPELSEWAIKVGEKMVSAFRTAWEKMDGDVAGNASAVHGAYGPAHGFDPVEMEPGAGALDRSGDDVAEFSRRARARIG